MIITGKGIPNTYPPPIKPKFNGNPYIGLPPVTTMVRPLAILIVASVAINGGVLILLVIKKLLNSPIKPPRSIPAVIETIMLMPCFNKMATNTEDSASVDPTDKSIPPEIITQVIPTATIAMIDTCLNTFKIFEAVKKYGDTKDRIMLKEITPTNAKKALDLVMSRFFVVFKSLCNALK